MRTYLLLWLLTVTLLCKGQSPKTNVNFASPNATGLGLYGEVPVSLHNGVPNVSIPMFEINEGPIKVPVTLSYHASGVRPDVHPGWVGNGWTLNCGGLITRVVKGAPDETAWEQNITFFDSYFTTANRAFMIGHYYNTLLQDNNWATPARIQYLAARGTEYAGGPDYYQETEPDEFIFNFGSYSGKFVFDENHQLKCISHPEIKVEMSTPMLISYAFGATNINGQQRYFTYAKNYLIGNIGGIVLDKEIKFTGFRITTPDGMQYEFGLWDTPQSYEDIPMEASINFFQQIYAFESWDTWYLKKIVAPTGHSVTFYYGVPDDGIRYPIASFGNTVAMEKSSGSSNPSGIWSIFGPLRSRSTSIRQYYEGRIIYPAYLTKVVTSNEEFHFKLGVSTELPYDYYGILSSLQLQSQYWDQNLTFAESARDVIRVGPTGNPYYEELDFSLFKWRQLNKVIIRNKRTQEDVKTWNFSYSANSSQRLTLLGLEQTGGEGVSPLRYSFEYNTSKSLPGYNSYQTDHWGFFNGKTPNLGVLSDSYLYGFYNYKNPDPDFLYAGILERINYPTGGYTTFTYEPHRYEARVIRNASTGAFSLQTTSPSYAGGLRIREINSTAGYGAPVLTKRFEYEGGILNGDAQYFWKNYTGKLLNGNNYVSDRFVTQTILPVGTNSIGSHIGYTKVKEITPGTGYTVHEFSNYDLLDENFLATIDPEKSRYSPFSTRSIERGLPKEKTDYNENGVMVRKLTFRYPTPDLSKFIRATNAKSFLVLGGEAIEGSSYKIYTYPFNSDRLTEVTYQTGSSTALSSTTVTDFTFDGNKNLLRTTTTTASNTQPQVITYQYPFDMVPAEDPNGVYAAMTNRNFIAPVIKEIRSKNNVQTSLTHTGYFAPSTGLFVPGTVSVKNGSNPDYVQTRFHSYDSRGNILTISTENNMKMSYLWGYSQNYPIAQVQNANFNECFFDAFENEGTWNGITYDQTRSHTGRYSGKIVNQGPGELVLHSNTWLNISLSAPTKFKYSGWVYSDGPGAELFLFMKRAGETNYFTHVDNIATNVTGQWVYLEKEFTVPADITQLNIRIDNNSAGTVWFDDIRLHPSTAKMSTYTYAPALGMTSQTDFNNQSTYYEYDGMGRLKIVRNNDREIVKTYEYNYRTVFYNKAASIYLNRNNCGPGHSGTGVTYTVPAGKYSSLISQEDADVQAANDILANAQNYANNPANGATCYPSSIYASLTVENLSPDGTYGDLVIRFYADQAMTIPATVSNYYITYNQQTWCNSGSLPNFMHSATVSGHEVVLMNSAQVYYTSSYWDNFCGCWQLDECWVYYSLN